LKYQDQLSLWSRHFYKGFAESFLLRESTWLAICQLLLTSNHSHYYTSNQDQGRRWQHVLGSIRADSRIKYQLNLAWDRLLADPTVGYLANQFCASIKLTSQNAVKYGIVVAFLHCTCLNRCPKDKGQIFIIRLHLDCWSAGINDRPFSEPLLKLHPSSSPIWASKHSWRHNTIPTGCLLIPWLCSAPQSPRA